MPQPTESDCAPGNFIIGTALGTLRVAARPETAGQGAQRGPEVGTRGYRPRPRPGGTLGCGAGVPPARGEAGSSMAAPHGGPGV